MDDALDRIAPWLTEVRRMGDGPDFPPGWRTAETGPQTSIGQHIYWISEAEKAAEREALAAEAAAEQAASRVEQAASWTEKNAARAEKAAADRRAHDARESLRRAQDVRAMEAGNRG